MHSELWYWGLLDVGCLIILKELCEAIFRMSFHLVWKFLFVGDEMKDVVPVIIIQLQMQWNMKIQSLLA